MIKRKTWAACLLLGLLLVFASVAVADDQDDSDQSSDSSGDSSTDQPPDPAEQADHARKFRPFRKIMKFLPPSWGGSILETQDSFERFVRRIAGDETNPYESAPVPTTVIDDLQATEPEADVTLASSFFYRPIMGGTTLYSVQGSGFAGELVLGGDYRASTLNNMAGELQLDPALVDPTLTTFTMSMDNFNAETLYGYYQLVPTALYFRVRF